MEFSRKEYWSRLPFPSPGDLPYPVYQTQVSCIAGRFFTIWATREAQMSGNGMQKHFPEIFICKSLPEINWVTSLIEYIKKDKTALLRFLHHFVAHSRPAIFLFKQWTVSDFSKCIMMPLSLFCAQSLNSGQLFVTPWTVAHQAPLSMEFSRQESWSGLPFPSPCSNFLWSLDIYILLHYGGQSIFNIE